MARGVKLLATLLGLAVAGSAISGVALGQVSFAGKTVTVVVGNPPGGGYDRLGRVVARHLGRFLPGNPTVVVQNMPGAAGVVAANHLYHVARPDGLTLGLFNQNMVFGQLLGVEGLRADMRKWQWVGSVTRETDVFTIRADLPYRNVQELRRADPPLAIGATAPGSGSYDFPLVLKAFLKLNVRIVSGYPGRSDIMLAIERKELDGVAGSWSSMKPFAQRGLVRVLVKTPSENPELRDVPSDVDLVTEPTHKAVLQLHAVPNRIGRPFVLPPAVPADVVRAYREAFRRLAEDPTFRTEAERLGFEVVYTSGEQCLRIVEEVLNSPPGVVRIFKSFFRFGE
ncbi:MAG: tripartite tricarboxylate transporter substrate-binding protein [Armatimonadota bacterium]|nr:tripartite tricarboxylate transporter substrate-binding protein [Armatimonadota bacterium]MDR7429056.1 tripartite tricarboxylate transporter substrate-binding protein [Armatimonadota bacterium]MDR7577189.1 tripartite tricarboxylate transporter substrate-binding protein [Armatimonadota bacterium]MDR7593932.1 tripartite tricarboxylate transporter substrate-binding protein [Armatimonadota bacterium]